MSFILRSELITCENMCTEILKNSINSREDRTRFNRPTVRITEEPVFNYEYILRLSVFKDGKLIYKKMHMHNIRDCGQLDQLISLNIIHLISDLLNYEDNEIEFCTFSIDELDDYEIK